MKKFFTFLAAILISIAAMAQEQATARVIVPSDCSMDVSQGLWLAWYNGYEDYRATIVPMKQEGRIFTATFTPESGEYGYYFLNASSSDGENVARTYSRYNLNVMDTLCWEMRYSGGGSYYNADQVNDCNLQDHNYMPSDLKATPLGRDSILFEWKMTQEVSNNFQIVCYDQYGNPLFGDAYWNWTPEASARSYRVKANVAEPVEVAYWQITARDERWYEYTAKGAGFAIEGDARIPHNLQVTENGDSKYTITWEAGDEVDHFYLAINGLETPIEENNLKAKSYQATLPDNGDYYVDVESRDAEDKPLGRISTNFNLDTKETRDLVLHFYIPQARAFMGANGAALKWRNTSFAGDHVTALVAEGETAPNWYKATIKDFNRVAILFSLINASTAEAATKELTYAYSFGEYEAEGYYVLTEDKNGELSFTQQTEYNPWYPNDYAASNLQISQKMNKLIFQWESAAETGYRLQAYSKEGEIVWTTTYAGNNYYEESMDNAEPVEILYWVLTPQVGYNYGTALATYSKEPFIVQPSPFIPKNLQAKDNGDGTYTFSWDKVELDTVKQYRLEVVDPSGNGVLGRYNLTTNSVTEPVQFLFSGRAAMKVSPMNSWGSTMGMAVDSFDVKPVAAHDLTIRVMINPLSGIDTSEGVQFEIKKDAKSAYEPVNAIDDKYGWWKYTLNTTEPGAMLRLKGGWRTLDIVSDTCIMFDGSYFNEEECDAHADDYMPQNISVLDNHDGTYTIAWSMNYTEKVGYYQVDLYDEHYNYYLNEQVQTLQVKTPVLATAGNYHLNIIVYNKAHNRIGYGTTNFEIKPVEAREIQLSVLAQPGTPMWNAYTYNVEEGGYTTSVVFTPAEGGWQTAVFNTTDPALTVRFQKSGGWYYSEPTDIILTENTCIEWNGKEFKKADCNTTKLNDYTLSNLKVESKGKGGFHFSWDCKDNPDAFNIRLMYADTIGIRWSTNPSGEERSADYQFDTDSAMEMVWYVVPVMNGEYDNNYLWDLGVYGPKFNVEATMQKITNLTANKNADGTWTIRWDKIVEPNVSYYSVVVVDENGSQTYYNSVQENQCVTDFIGKIGTHAVTVMAYDKEGALLGKATTKLTVTEVPARELTVRVLLHPDAEATITPMRCQTGPGVWDVADPQDQGNGWYKFTFTSTMPAPDVVVLGFQPTIKGDTCLQFTRNNLSSASCDEVAHDYRIVPGSMKAVSEPGRVTFSWSGVEKSEAYEVNLYYYDEQYSYWNYFFSGMAYDTAFVYNVPDNRDGLEIKWAVAPRQPHYLNEFEASEKVILHKSQIILSSLKTLTTDSIHYRLSWTCNTDTVQYQLQLRSGGYPYIDQQLSRKQFDFTALSGYTNYSWAIRAVTATGEPLTTWYNSEPFYAKRSLRMVSNLQGSASGKTLRFTWNTNAERVRAELWMNYDNWTREPIFPKGDSIITDKSFSITVKEDARYYFLLYAQVKDGEGNWVDVYEENGMYLNVFNDVKTYTVNVSATTGGNFWGMNPSGDYPEGYELMLRPSAEEGYRFVKWSDGETSEFRRIKVTSDITLIALYEKIPEYHVVLSATEGGVLKLYYGDREFTKIDTTVVGGWYTYIQAIPNEGYELNAWSDGYDAAETRRSISFDSDSVITAVFKPFCYVTIAAQEGGRVQFNGAIEYDKAKKAYKCSYGAEVSIKANPNDGYRFVKWSDGDFNISRMITVTKNMSFTAEFAEASTPLAKYAVQILSNDVQLGEVGQVSGTYTEGDKLTLTATPKEGAEFVQWSDGNKEATRVITIASDTTIIAYFQYKRVTITVNAAAGGTVNAEEINGTYNYGTIVTLIATPDEHYHFIGWSDGSTENNRMITLKEDITITANFAKQQYLITFLNADGSYIESNSWNYGDIPSCTVTPTMEPDEQWNYIFAGWTPEIKAVTGNAIYTAVYTKDPNPGQAIDTVQGSKVQGLKVMENGILYIQYNGMKYNVMGNSMK